MKLGEIKLEALRIMNCNVDRDLKLSNYNLLLSENKFKKYLFNMTESINRAIDIINASMIETKTISLLPLYCGGNEKLSVFDLTNLNDFYSVVSVFDFSKEFLFYPFETAGNKLVCHTDNKNLSMEYFVKFDGISNETSENDEVNIPDKICRLIPYFIKYDLYQEDEPSLAMVAKNNFENGLSKLKKEFYSLSYLIET